MKTLNAARVRFHQAGVTLMELLIAMSISLVVALAMVSLMANTLGTGTATIEMARLTAEMRTAMQIMSRDLRRANFHGNFTKCFGNLDCRATLNNGDGDVTSVIKPITIGNSAGTNDCFFYWFDRDADGDVTDDDDVGAFRRVVQNGVGVIQMTTTRNTAPSCNSGNYWTAITDPSFVDITTFAVNNNNSYTDTISAAAGTQRIDKVGLSITGQLVRDANISKTVADLIRIRNDIFAPAP